MTTIPVTIMDSSFPSTQATRGPSLARVWLASIAAMIYPRASRLWLRATLLQCAMVAAFNSLAAVGWLFVTLVCAMLWQRETIRVPISDGLSVRLQTIQRWITFPEAARSLLSSAGEAWRHGAGVDEIALVIGLVAFVITAFLVPFFVLLPFAARPGPNKPCVRHVFRTVCLGTGFVHGWGVAFALAALALSPTFQSDFERSIAPLLLVFSGLLLWTLLVLVHAVRREYRGPADMPESHDPWCDDCGYNLVAAESTGRCPECGRSVLDSLGAHTRPPTAWESRPRLSNLRAISDQILRLIRSPRALFFSMPTLTGQSAAQRWLTGSMIAVSFLASLMVPAIVLALHYEWSLTAVAGSIAMGLVWAIFGLMMVGIETAGIATFSRMRGHHIYLAASAKVTSYSSTLMLFWVFLGGIQLVSFVWLQSNYTLQRTFHLSIHGEQIALATSLAIAHIGGLLWYELTVYRGVRAIQFANK